jgi:hypothetical protein
MALRLRDRLMDMKKENIENTNGTDLVVLKKQLVETAFKEQLNVKLGAAGNSKVTYRQGSIFEAGKKAGDAVRFNREVHDGPQGGVKLIA